MQIGIVGLPNSGKTTIFNALTRGEAETTAYASGAMEVHTAVVDVPDSRVDRLSEIFKPKRTIYAKVQYNDIGGVAKGIGSSGGASGQFLNRMSQNDALLLVIRAFKDNLVPHPEGSIDPVRDVEIVQTEFLLSDMALVENRLKRVEERLKKGGDPKERAAYKEEHDLLERLQTVLEEEKPLRGIDLTLDEEKLLRAFGLLTLKPLLVVVNAGEDGYQLLPKLEALNRQPETSVMVLQGKVEMELAQMEPEEAAEFLDAFGIQEPGLNRVIRRSYGLLGLQSFFTVGEDEVRAWTIREGATAVEAAAAIHTDLARGFIRAEVISYDDLMSCDGSMAEARKKGLLRLEGKEYVVQDGDIVHIRFHV